jgi:hypothetical protein
MADLHPGFGGLYGDAQFFMQLAVQRRRDRLAVLDLAAGKFPQTTLMNVIRSAGDQHPSRRADQDAHGDMNGFHVRYSALMRT